MTPHAAGEYALKIAVALLCGAAIGMERQWRHRLSLLRTNALVAIGAALFVSLTLLTQNADRTRIAAQVASGVGFIGAGIMLRDGLNIRGLNTAATLWCSAAVGCLCGLGYYIPAFIGSVAVLVANVALRPLALRLDNLPEETTEIEAYYRLRLVCRAKKENVVRLRLLSEIRERHAQLTALETADGATPDEREVRATILIAEGERDREAEAIIAHFVVEKDILAASWERQSNGQMN